MVLLLAGCASQGLYRWVPFVGRGGAKTPRVAKVKANRAGPFGPVSGPVVYGVEVRLVVNGPVIRLAETRALEARLVLINRSRKSVNLLFNDSHRCDFVLRDAAGKKLVQWSDDQPVTANPSTVIINPDERAEFAGSISTRDMAPGRTYTLEGLVVGYPSMRQVVTVQAGA